VVAVLFAAGFGSCRRLRCRAAATSTTTMSAREAAQEGTGSHGLEGGDAFVERRMGVERG
jgi:hypothetical protein